MVYIIHECHCGTCPGSYTPKHPSGEMLFGGSLCRCKCHPENRISPHILYKQAKGDKEEYKRLLIENRHLIPIQKEAHDKYSSPDTWAK